MRLTCPNCSAQYEVPDEVIPEEGRDVQCSNCEKTWFQAKHPADPAVEQPTDETTAEDKAVPPAESETADQTEPEPETAPKDGAPVSNVDPSVADILREEAAREAELRAQEGSSLESQPDLALDPPSEPEPDPEQAVKELTATETAKDSGQGDALPDVETINSGFRGDASADAPEVSAPAPRKSGGFLRGFALILILGVILFLIYGNAPQISEAVPQADAVLKPYVSLVDQARLWLDTQAGASQN
ncbi:zinc-ribbon domain-containing protein [Ruegeria faecimaris]|uniref:zinc-ribbon domain-containing protein n=1 Tax=Ruegeria faecimaris TaxID=686389 RepID=UPI00232BC787|nr:zinc-ribbon domain-containing protein [Ruegeria faecimaris]